MRLLLDENISHRIVASLAQTFPGSRHVSEVGLAGASDDVIYDWAVTNGFALVTKDDDFVALAAARHFAAPLVLVRLGNVTNQAVLKSLVELSDRITALINGETRIVEII